MWFRWLDLLAAHLAWLVAGPVPEQAQRDVWDTDPDAILSTSFSGGPGPEIVDGGLHITQGLWRFSTGVHHSGWVALLAPVPQENAAPDMRFLLIPRSEVEIIEDWRSAGLAGTGSCSIAARDIFVPHYRALRPRDVLDFTAPGLFQTVWNAVTSRHPARVHLWYEKKFGTPCPPYTSTEDAIDSFAATTCCLGVRLEPAGRWT